MSSNYEGMSNSLLEALALGVPVISTDHPIGGARMFIKNGIMAFLQKSEIQMKCLMLYCLQLIIQKKCKQWQMKQ